MDKRTNRERARKAFFVRTALHSRVMTLARRASFEANARIGQERVIEAALAVPDDVIIKRVKQAARV